MFQLQTVSDEMAGNSVIALCTVTGPTIMWQTATEDSDLRSCLTFCPISVNLSSSFVSILRLDWVLYLRVFITLFQTTENKKTENIRCYIGIIKKEFKFEIIIF